MLPNHTGLLNSKIAELQNSKSANMKIMYDLTEKTINFEKVLTDLGAKKKVLQHQVSKAALTALKAVEVQQLQTTMMAYETYLLRQQLTIVEAEEGINKDGAEATNNNIIETLANQVNIVQERKRLLQSELELHLKETKFRSEERNVLRNLFEAVRIGYEINDKERIKRLVADLDSVTKNW